MLHTTGKKGDVFLDRPGKKEVLGEHYVMFLIEKVDIKDIRNRELIPDQIRIHLEDQDPDRDQGPIIEMAASPPTIPKYSEEKKGKVLL